MAYMNTPPAVKPGRAHTLRLLPVLDSDLSLNFPPLEHTLQEGGPHLIFKRVCGGEPTASLDVDSNTISFNTRVISRVHAEMWAEGGGRIFVKDTSSVGTFLNGDRLSPSSEGSKPLELHNGDTLQLGNNYEGGEGDMYKCVRVKIGFVGM